MWPVEANEVFAPISKEADARLKAGGVAVPPTVLLPHKHHPPGTTERSMRNLQYPIDWDAVFAYVGFPAFLKPHDGGGWKDVYKVDSPQEFFEAYDQSRDLCMTLQRGVNFQEIGTRMLLVASVPTIAALAVQRYIVRGLSLGAVKG